MKYLNRPFGLDLYRLSTPVLVLNYFVKQIYPEVWDAAGCEGDDGWIVWSNVSSAAHIHSNPSHFGEKRPLHWSHIRHIRHLPSYQLYISKHYEDINLEHSSSEARKYDRSSRWHFQNGPGELNIIDVKLNILIVICEISKFVMNFLLNKYD